MKSHWLITVLLLVATGCKPQQSEPLAIKVKPLQEETIGSSTPVISATTATNTPSTKAETRSLPSGSLSPKVSPKSKTTSQTASSTKTDARSLPSGSPSPRVSPKSKTTSQATSSTKTNPLSSPTGSPSPQASPTAKTTTSASEAVLTATNPKSQINFRSTPSTSSKRLGYGKVGERVQVIEQKAGADGYTWYKVRFPRSGAQGWIRKDFIKVTAKQPPSKSGVPAAPPTPSNQPSPKNGKPNP